MLENPREKIEIINRPSVRYWPKILIYLKKNYRKDHPILKKFFFIGFFQRIKDFLYISQFIKEKLCQ